MRCVISDRHNYGLHGNERDLRARARRGHRDRHGDRTGSCVAPDRNDRTRSNTPTASAGRDRPPAVHRGTAPRRCGRLGPSARRSVDPADSVDQPALESMAAGERRYRLGVAPAGGLCRPVTTIPADGVALRRRSVRQHRPQRRDRHCRRVGEGECRETAGPPSGQAPARR